MGTWFSEKKESPKHREITTQMEGPYTAMQAGRLGSFYLKDPEGRTSTHFDIGTDPDLAQVLVQNRVAIALSSLPQVFEPHAGL
jgi:hypothetical protein